MPKQYESRMPALYRLFWNITKGATHQWVIDTGEGTKRLWVKAIRQSNAPFITNTGNNHPKGWIEVKGNLVIDDEGYASFF